MLFRSQDPEMFRVLVYMPKLKEGDKTPDPQTWCNGFVEGMGYNPENWAPIFATKFGLERIAPILMTSAVADGQFNQAAGE